MADGPLSRTCKKVLAAVCVMLFYCLSACKSGSTDAGLGKLATSQDAVAARNKAESQLRAKAAAIQTHYTWLTLVRVELVDRCMRGPSKNPFDPNPPAQAKLLCDIWLLLYFAPDLPVPDVVDRVTATGGPTAWTTSSVRNALNFYETAGYENPQAHQPRMISGTGEALEWDSPPPGALLQEPCQEPRPVYRRCLSEPSQDSLASLRNAHGRLFLWTLTNSYLTV